jgi:hypothetical protein
MKRDLVLSLRPTETATRLLMTCDGDEVLKAVLAPAITAHPRAAATLLEGLALFYQQRLSVVLSVAGLDDSCVIGLSDGLGIGRSTIHYEVEVCEPRRRGRRLGGLGTFRDLRQLCMRGVL